MTRYHAYWFVGMVVLLQPIVQEAYTAQDNVDYKKKGPTTLAALVGPEVLKLSGWPDESVLARSKMESTGTSRAMIAKTEGRNWIGRVLAPSWLPPKHTEMFFSPSETRHQDVFRMKWQSNDYEIEVSQTERILVMRLIPSDNKGTGANADDRLKTAHDICLKVFTDVGRWWCPEISDSVPVSDLAQKIASYSFSSSTTRTLEGGILFGRPKTREDEGVKRLQADNERVKEQMADNPMWDKSHESWRYWFRKVYWWNDGKSVVILLMKKERGSEADVSP